MSTNRRLMKKVQQSISLLLVMLLSIANLPAIAVNAAPKHPKKPISVRATSPGAKTKPHAFSARERAASMHAVKGGVALSSNPSDLEIRTAHLFPELLIPMEQPPISGENRALASAINSFKAKNDIEQITDLTNFIAAYPRSRWRASLELNVGLLRFETGYLSDALTYWTSAWNGSKSQKGQMQQPVAERSLSELLELDARLGRTEELKKYFAELGKRGFHGASATRMDAAKEGLYAEEHSPQTAFKCGPYAVNTLLYLNQKSMGFDPRLKAAASTRNGTNLAQVKDWADMVGLNMQMAKRDKGAAILIPAVVHFRVGHFSAMTSHYKDKYRLQDSTFGEASNAWVSRNAIDSQSDGYFLVPSGTLPPGWHSVSRSEAEKVWGRGSANGHKEGKCPSQPKSCPNGMCCKGMAVASAWTMQAELNIMDTPVSYSPPIGPSMNFLINYNQNEQGQPATPSFTGLGAWWSLNWVSWVNVQPGYATVNVRGGGQEQYNYTQPDNVSNPYPPNLTSQAILTIAGDGIYNRLLPDGSIEVFSLADGAGNFYMTSVVDPQGNAATINWDTTHFRVNSISDANGFVTTINYVSNTIGNSGYYLVASIADPFGRVANFGYDSTNTYLQASTDAVGNVSSFAYVAGSSQINAMGTPYGATRFVAYTPPGVAPYAPRGLKFFFPDGTTSVIENWLGETKTTYFWDREATALYPLDPVNQIYTHCKQTKFLFDPSTSLESPVINWVKPALEAQVVYQTEGEQLHDYEGTSNNPIQITRSIAGNPATMGTIGGTATQGDVVTIIVMDAGLTGGQESVNYTVKPSDTLNDIAAGLATNINNDAALKPPPLGSGIGVTASSNGSNLQIQSISSNVTTYSQSTSSGATETITLVPVSNPPEIATVSLVGVSSPTPGDSLQIIVHDSGLPGGQEAVRPYVVQTGDGLSNIANGLANNLNQDQALNSLGFVASPSSSGAVNMQSYSINSTTYTKVITGTTEDIAFAPGITVQTWNYQYNAFGHVTQSIDPLGRTFSYLYSANNVDLLEIRETQNGDNNLMGKWEYNSQHRPTLYIDASCEQTHYVYNSFGELTQLTDALSDVTTLTYGSTTTASIAGSVGLTAVNQTITVFDSGLPGGQQAITYLSQPSDTPSIIASQLASLINANSNLAALRVTASAAGAVLSMSSTSTGTTYTKTPGGSITITLANSAASFLVKDQGPLSSLNISTFTWNSTGTLASSADSEGYVQRYFYDQLDRRTQVIYPDGTSEQSVYLNMDAIAMIDRLGRTTQRSYDSMDQLGTEIDPLGRKTQYTWCACGSLATLVDGLGHTTTWSHDLEGRTIEKTMQDGSSTSYAYETTTSRLHSKTDALNQVSTYSYNLDNSLATISYGNAVNPTSTVSISYDSAFPRISSAQNGWGTYSYSYNSYTTDPYASALPGRGRLNQISNTVMTGAAVVYGYDALGRTTTRTIGSDPTTTWNYDGINRITSEVNSLGTFGYTYVDQSPTDKGTFRLAKIAYPTANGQTTNFNWYSTTYDERLQGIQNLASNSNGISQFNLAYDSAGEITRWQQQQANSHLSYGLTYDPAGQLIAAQAGAGISEQPYVNQFYYGYDAAANRTAAQQNGGQIAVVSGSATNLDTITITVTDNALSGGQETVASYHVSGTDTPSTIAANVAALVTSDLNLQAVGINATPNGSTINLKSKTGNLTTYSAVIGGAATEKVTFGANTLVENITLGGTLTNSNVISIKVYDPALLTNPTTVSHTVNAVTDTLNSIAADLASQLQSNLTAINATATSTVSAFPSIGVITITTTSPNVTSYSYTQGSNTETVAFSPSLNGTTSASVGGSVTVGDVVKLAVTDNGLASSPEVASYTVASGNTLANVTSGLASAINSDSSLQKIGVTASTSGTSGTILNVTSASANATTYVSYTSNSAGTGYGTEAILWGLPANGIETATVGGTISANDTVSVTVYDFGITGGSQTFTYPVGPTDTLNSIANGLKLLINAALSSKGITASVPNSTTGVLNISSTSQNTTTYTGAIGGTGSHTETITMSPTTGVSQATYNNVNELTGTAAGGAVLFQGTTDRPVKPVTMNSGTVKATMLSTQAFSATPGITTGVTGETITATSGGGVNQTNTYQTNVTGPASTSLYYDNNGNLANDGTNIYSWDAENVRHEVTNMNGLRCPRDALLPVAT